MNVVYEKCAGLDVHKKTVVGCASILDLSGHRHKERQTFNTMTPDLLRLRQWLKDLGVTHVAMESTANYWKPIFNVLEGHVEVLVVNAQHLKAVPGRKTDRHRMLNGSPICCNMACFVPALCLPLSNERSVN